MGERIQPFKSSEALSGGALGWVFDRVRSAFAQGVSDVHLAFLSSKPRGEIERLEVDQRLQGRLVAQVVPVPMHPLRILLSLKTLAQLEPIPARIPQEGQFSCPIFSGGVSCVEVRVSIVPLKWGEKVVLRIFQNGGPRAVGSWAPRHSSREFCESAWQSHYLKVLCEGRGLILATGGPGVGKTTALYESAGLLRARGRNVYSIEDPVEAKVEGVHQIEVNPRIGLGFSDSFRALLRQDPDGVLIGEIRDFDTAVAALLAAQSGLVVLSSLHVPNLFWSLLRLERLGVPSAEVAAVLLALVDLRWVSTPIGLRLERRGLFMTPGRRAKLVALQSPQELEDSLSDSLWIESAPAPPALE